MTTGYQAPDNALLNRLIAVEKKLAAMGNGVGRGQVHIQAPHPSDVTITSTTYPTSHAISAAVPLTKPGLYLATCFFDFDFTVAAAGAIAAGSIASAGGVAIEYIRVCLLECSANPTRVTVGNQWKLTVTSAGTVTAVAYKAVAGGTLICRGQSSGSGNGVLTLVRTGPV